MKIYSVILYCLNTLVLLYFFLLNSTYLMTCILAFFKLKDYRHQLQLIQTQELLSMTHIPSISIIAPAYNEAATCVEAIHALLNLEYPEYEILLINDGSKDQTLEILKQAFDLHPVAVVPMADLVTQPVKQVYKSRNYPLLWVIDKENGGKADALNVGLNFCHHPLFCAIDADTLIERDALLRIVRPFLEDFSTVAAGGIIRIINDCEVEKGKVKKIVLPHNFWARIQVLEYLRAFLVARVGWDTLNALLIISGAFGLFKRSMAIEVGGYDTQTVGEDMELVVRMHRHCREEKIPYRISFVPDPVAWTECPEDLKMLSRQRERWQRGLTEVMFKHKVFLFQKRYGILGWLVFPYFFILETWGILLEFCGYFFFLISALLGKLSLEYMLAFFSLAFLYGLLISFMALFLEEFIFYRYRSLWDIAELLYISLAENFGFRQLSSYWRFKGTLKTLLGIQGQWGKMERKGFQKKSETQAK
ncbi:glycosyl transferase [bacterium (Candidatus Blackallbacteria) CG17_big_fil_post_rev_8_21_14_2_50_48_46]|uniref:Glycosyl transferase n=1 Tax=bacterium (Candidatus Blackallbacteria) CG17_big_fil_post_rev_8_21_14_2_50_48_46 TaxID=2014261 RepID=A0A2M7G2T5_9BACT|nr:MAG: glycosyl transferase [bacterium (Candidatus Blackallbacteria) CG18_big_fil_WC_8_21_14_2_50_49_26]PIW16143.1 MAG: glycosyl transferase [bacterium (Candidatus Blackallbacteria) CG17_big_fil_post_rev_8_21_14_2_50_48_46]PIW44230.1 MAG: glycosyl transferase [bacterium (Candidatus Blackallbacteria) CG13_big_fil_rev_8_21_14_2_50_49_14]